MADYYDQFCIALELKEKEIDWAVRVSKFMYAIYFEDEIKEQEIYLEEFKIQAIQKKFNINDPVEVSISQNCSKCRPGGFGGHAIWIEKDSFDSCSTNSWLHDKRQEHRRKNRDLLFRNFDDVRRMLNSSEPEYLYDKNQEGKEIIPCPNCGNTEFCRAYETVDTVEYIGKVYRKDGFVVDYNGKVYCGNSDPIDNEVECMQCRQTFLLPSDIEEE